MAQHYGNLVQHYGQLAARAVGVQHYGNLVQHYGSIARRDTMASASVDMDMDRSFQMKIQALPTWGVAVLLSTICLGFLALASIRYTLHRVVATLAMIENPQTTILIREEKYSEKPDALAEDVDEEVLVIKQKPITSNIRSTMRLLQSHGGFRARWRGLSAMIAYGLTYMSLQHLTTSLFGTFAMQTEYVNIAFGPIVASILSHLLVARLGLTWTHIVISEPSAKPWYRRIPDRKSWKKIVGPTFFNACAWELASAVPAIMAEALGIDKPEALTEENARGTALKLLFVAAIALVTFVEICIPAEVSLRRVQASMLPEQDKAIVPFDRSFGGLVVPESAGGRGKLSYAQAWATFDRSARIRLLKLYGKIFVIEVALHVFLGLVLALEFFAIVGPKLEGLQVTGPGEVRIQ